MITDLQCQSEHQSDCAKASDEIALRMPTYRELARNSVVRHGKNAAVGTIIRCRRRIGYFTPEEFYESTVDRLIQSDTTWLDVGCGRDLLPMNPRLARRLSQRCRQLVGVDPDPNVLENQFVHERVQSVIEDFKCNQRFDLITMRMVVEHITDPAACIDALQRLTRPGSKIIVYTPHRFSMTSLASAVTPTRMHHIVKHCLWNTEQRDTFPAYYRMNTIASLRHAFDEGPFALLFAKQLDDAALFHAYPRIGKLELYFWRMGKSLRVGYPETNILAVFTRL